MRQRKYRKPRLIKNIFLVVCEGETEESYVNMLKQHYRLPITIKSKVAGNKINNRLINQYIKELSAGDDENISVFYVYDLDVADIKEKLMSLPGKTLFSNPCIELWYYLHHENQSSAIDTKNIIRKLKGASPEWNNYQKGGLNLAQKNILLKNKEEAIQRAKSLAAAGNPSTNIYEFLEILEKGKMV